MGSGILIGGIMKLNELDNMKLEHELELRLDLRVRQINSIIASLPEEDRLHLTAEIIRDIASTNRLKIKDWF